MIETEINSCSLSLWQFAVALKAHLIRDVTTPQCIIHL